jgi:phenylacetate-CoA ligase
MFKKIRFYHYTRWLQKSQYWPRERLDTLIQRQLKKTVRRAAAIAFWQDRFLRADFNLQLVTKKYLTKLPILSKRDFLDSTETYLDARAKGAYAEATSGSTGEPFTVHHDEYFELLSCAVRERLYRLIGNGRRFPILFLRPTERRSFALWQYKSFFIRTGGKIPDQLPTLIKDLRTSAGEFILYCLGSFAFILAEACNQAHVQLPLRGVIVTGEQTSLEQRREIESTFGVRLFNAYGMTEVGLIAFNCEKGRLHINEEWVYVEITDAQGTPLPPDTEGWILVTSLENRVMPFIRYNSGDRGQFISSPCPCGRTLQTVELRGRQMHLITFEDGRTISLIDVVNIFSTEKKRVQQFQIIRISSYAFIIRVIPGPQFQEEKEKLTERFRLLIHPNITIEWNVVEAIEPSPSGKFVYFFDDSK